MAIRAVTWVSGKCPACGAEPKVTPHPEVSVAVVSFQHDADCPVAELLDPSGP